MDRNLIDKEIGVEEAKKILGKIGEGMTDKQLQDQIVKIKFLVESWLDDYERSIFEGKTLGELQN